MIDRSMKIGLMAAGAGLLVVIGFLVLWLLFSTPAEGYLSMHVLPWAELNRLTAEDGSKVDLPRGERITPLCLKLPEGRYRAVVRLGGSGKWAESDFTIRAGEVTAVTRGSDDDVVNRFLVTLP